MTGKGTHTFEHLYLTHYHQGCHIPDRCGHTVDWGDGVLPGWTPHFETGKHEAPVCREMVTFHGVFDGVGKLSYVKINSTAAKFNILICTREGNPFVPEEDLGAAMKMFSDLGYQSNMMKFKRAWYSSTNPVQDYNLNEAFGCNSNAYTKA